MTKQQKRELKVLNRLLEMGVDPEAILDDEEEKPPGKSYEYAMRGLSAERENNTC